MGIVYNLIVVLHLLGMATILCGVVAHHVGAAPGLTIALGGAVTQVLTGLALVGIASAKLVDTDVNNTKIAVKLLVALAVLVLVFLVRRKKNPSTGAVHSVAALTIANVVVAAMW